MRCRSLVVVSIAFAACKGNEPDVAPGRPPVVHRIADAPRWAVPYGGEFWRPAVSPTTTTRPSRAVTASPELDLSETMERVGHAFDADLKTSSATFTASLDGESVRFEPAHSIADAKIALRSIERGENVLWQAGDGGDAFAIGNTVQRQLRDGLVAHVESRREGVELTWVLASEPEGDGALHLSIGVDGMIALGRTGTGYHFADAFGASRVRVSDAVVHDSGGARWNIELTADADGDLAIDVPAEVLRRAHYPLAIDPVVSAEFGMDTPQSGETDARSPRVSCVGGTCLAIWLDLRSGQSQIMGTRFTASTGTVADPLGLLLASDATNGSCDIVFTGSDFLIAYDANTGGIKAKRVTITGTTPDPAFVVTTSGYWATMATNGTETLIAYARTLGANDIYAAVVDGTTVVKTDAAVYLTGVSDYIPHVAWDGNAFVLTWYSYNGTDYDVMASRTTDGANTFATYVIAGGANHQTDSDICSSGSGSLVTWRDSATNNTYAQRFDATFAAVGSAISLGSMGLTACTFSGSTYLVAGSTHRNRIDATTGALLDGASGLTNPTSWATPDLEPNGSQFLAVYLNNHSDHDAPYITRIASNDTLVDASGIALQSLAAAQTTPAVASDGTTYFVVWTESGTGTTNTRGVVLDANGTAVDPAGFTLGAGYGNYRLGAAYGGGHYIATWIDSNQRPRTARVLATSAVEDATPATLNSAIYPYAQGPDIAFDGTRFVAAWYDSSGNIWANTISTSGIPGTAFAVSASSSYEYDSRIACLPSGRCLIAWTFSTSTNDIYMARIDGGALLDTTPLPLANDTSTSEFVPSIASNGTAFLVAYWMNSGSGARRVDDAATVLDSSRIAISSFAPTAVDFDGTNYVVVGSGLRATQITPGGVALNPSGLILASSTYATDSVTIAHGSGSRQSLVVYRTYDDATTVQNRRIKARFVVFNGAPISLDQTVATNEDNARSITLLASDSDGDTLTYSTVAGPTHGTLSGTGKNLTYTPDTDYSGSDSFTFKTNDGGQDSNTATVSITVSAVNDPPVADDSSVTTVEDSVVATTLSLSDVDSSVFAYTITTPPQHGTLSGTAPNLIYTPATNYSGTDSFGWQGRDNAFASSNTATFTITVTAVNDRPTAIAQSVTTNEDIAASITLAGTDPDGDLLSYSVVTGPAHGSLSGTAPNLTYTPAANYNGGDSFTFTVSDALMTSSAATISINVASVNDAPVASNSASTTAEDTAVSIPLVATDIDGGVLTYSIVTGPAHGTLSGTAPNLTYTPAANYNGPDSFSWKANDNTADSNTATAAVTINAVNDTPVANAQTVATDEDEAIAITLTGSDGDGDSLTYTIVTPPAHGSLSGTMPNLTYTPTANYNGPDSFSFKASDATTSSSAATVAITVNSVNDAPVATDASKTTAEDTAVAVTVSATDGDGDMLTYTIGSPSHGTLSGTAPNLIYTPATNYNGSDSFSFIANDGTVDSNTATVTITINAANDGAVANAQSSTTDEDTAVAVTLSASDPDGDALTYAVVAGPAHGTLTGTAPNLTYTPVANYNGGDSFTFKVNDGTVDSNTATVSITITAVNDAPAASNSSRTTAEDTPVSTTMSATDIDGDTLSFAVVAAPAHGTLSGTAPNLFYTPAANYNGSDSFTWKANDGTADSNIATVSITISAANDLPVAASQSVNTNEDAAVSVTLSGSDVDGNSLTYAVIAAPAHGSLTGNAPNLTYTPAANYNGADSFTFNLNDGTADSNTATVSITIAAVNDAPVAGAQTLTVDQGQQLAITLAANDVDGDALTYAITSPPSDGTLTGPPPNLTYTAPSAFRGETSFTFTANDGTVDSPAATITIAVNNGAPVVAVTADLLNPLEGQSVTFTTTAADPGGDAITFAWDFGDGETSTDQNPVHVYVDDGAYTATVSVSDGLAITTATVDITVQNGAPIVVPSTDAVTGDEATALTFMATVSDPGAADMLTTTWTWGDGSADTTGTSATHTFADNGSYTVTVTVTDNGGATVTGTRTVTIGNVPPVPEALDPLATDPDLEVTAMLHATDRAGTADPLTWTLVDGPGEITGDGKYRWTPTGADAGSHIVTARVSDDDGGTADLVFQVDVSAPDDAGGCCSSSRHGGPTSCLLSVAVLALIRRRRRYAT